MLVLLPLFACKTSEPVDLAPLVRAKMVLRGQRPTLDEIDAYLEDPESLPDMVDGFARGDAYGDMIRDMTAERLWLRTDRIGELPALGPLADYTDQQIAYSLNEAPLKLVEKIVRQGRPFSEIVTSAEVWADPIVATAFGLDYDPAGPEWQATRWADGRPNAGLLTSTAVLQRAMSTETNLHRTRANMVARDMLCSDFLDRSTPPPVGDPIAAPDRIRTDPACVACHQDLDPLAAAFFGFRHFVLDGEVQEAYRKDCEEDDGRCYPVRLWEPALVADREVNDMPAPGLFGTPVDDLEHLGRTLGADPYFAVCQTRWMLAYMTGTDYRQLPYADVERLAGGFTQSGLDARRLSVDIVLDPVFAELGGGVVHAEQLSRAIEDLTGFQWAAKAPSKYGDYPLAQDGSHGYRVLLGGADGFDVHEPIYSPTPTLPLTVAWMAEEAAGFVVDADFALSHKKDRRLLTLVDPKDRKAAAVRPQLAQLHRRILTEVVREDGPEVTLTFDLFERVVERTDDPVHAWKVVLATLLQDSRFLVY